MEGFAQKIFDVDILRMKFNDKLEELTDCMFEETSWDEYDGSLELHQCDNDLRLSDECKKFIFDSGFIRIFVNHKDGWETHYTKSHPKDDGWRRKRKEDGNGFYVSYWPESWNQTQWLESGYIVVVDSK